MIRMEESAKFAKMEHLSSYSAAEALGADDLERITYFPKKGWFVTRWQATVIAIVICTIIFTTIYMSKSSEKSGKWDAGLKGKTTRYAYHPNVTDTLHSLPELEANEYNHGRRRRTNEDLLKFLVEPIHYDVKITSIPNFHSIVAKEWNFAGQVTIYLHSRENVDYLIIGVNELYDLKATIIKKANTINPGGESEEIEIEKFYHSAGVMRISFKQPLEASTVYELKISYHGSVRPLPYGVFYMIDRNPDTLRENYLIATNSATPYARSIFPCFDAREQNATYEISILQDHVFQFQSSLLHWETESAGEGQVWRRAKITHPMRTDQFQFTITSYNEQSVMTPDMMHFSVWTTRERRDEISYVLDIGSKLIEDLQVYFDLPPPTQKINIFALPQKIPYLKSRMGMIYAPESDVILRTTQNSEQHKRHVALSTAAHIAEQWIESMITFKHDEDEWLKECLVEYLKYKALSFAEPQWQLETEFYTDVQQVEMQNDISHFIAQHTKVTSYNLPHYSFPVRTLRDITRGKSPKSEDQVGFAEEAAAGIYNRLHRPKLNHKGACLLRMLQHMVTEPIFRISLTLFLEKSKKEDVLSNDFWTIMSAEIENDQQMDYQLLPEGVSLDSVIKTWTENDGYPILSVTRDYDKATITFAQLYILRGRNYNQISTFLPKHRKTTQLPGSSDANTQDDKQDDLNYWYIPISYTTQKEGYFSATAPRLWLGKTAEKTVDKPRSLHNDQWLLVNPQQTAFYRVNYDETNWRMLKKGLENNEFPPIVRSQLLDDALYFGRNGMLDYGFTLSLTLHMGNNNEMDYTVWKPVFRHLQYVQNLLIHAEDNQGARYETTIFQSFKTYVKWLITPAFRYSIEEKYTSHGAPTINGIMRSDIFLWACAVNIAACTDNMEKSFDSWKRTADPDENNPIESDLRYAVLCSIMRYGRKDDFDFLYERYANTLAINPDKYNYLKSLFCYPGENEIKRILNITLSPGYSEVLLNQIKQIWTAAGDSLYPTEYPFQYLMTNWEQIEKKYAEFHIIMTAMVKSSTNNIYTILSRDTLQKFRDEHEEQLPFLEKVLLTAAKAVDDKITWKTSRLDEFGAWLKSNLLYFQDEKRSADAIIQ